MINQSHTPCPVCGYFLPGGHAGPCTECGVELHPRLEVPGSVVRVWPWLVLMNVFALLLGLWLAASVIVDIAHRRDDVQRQYDSGHEMRLKLEANPEALQLMEEEKAAGRAQLPTFGEYAEPRTFTLLDVMHPPQYISTISASIMAVIAMVALVWIILIGRRRQLSRFARRTIITLTVLPVAILMVLIGNWAGAWFA